MISFTVISTSGVRADLLTNGSTLTYSQTLSSSSGQYVLRHMFAGIGTCFPTGVHVLRWNDPENGGEFPDWSTLWDGGSEGYGEHYNQVGCGNFGNLLNMQTDGNLVLYNGSSTPIWDTQTHGYGSGVYLSAQDDGNLVLYYNGSTPIWSMW